MRRGLVIGLLGAAGVTALAGVLFAQEMSGVDVESINNRAAAQANEAADIVSQSNAKAKAIAAEVAPLVAQSQAKIGQADVSGMNNVHAEDLARLSAGAGEQNLTDGPVHSGLIAFVSLSMPAESLRKIMLDMKKAGGIVVFRGFPNNNMGQFKTKLATVVPENVKFHNMGIDPRLFEAFHVETVPTYVVVEQPLTLCKALECESKVPDYDVVRGNVPLSYALETFANGRGVGAKIAHVALAQLDAQ